MFKRIFIKLQNRAFKRKMIRDTKDYINGAGDKIDWTYPCTSIPRSESLERIKRIKRDLSI